MKISTKGRYGLEALLDLAIHSDSGHINLRSISERCGLSDAYILQLFLVLRRAGIVDSVRGAQGGYILSRPASEITVGDVLIALEGPLSPVDCITQDGNPECSMSDTCSTRWLWKNMSDKVTGVANSITIEDLKNKYQNMIRYNAKPEYYI